MNLGARRISPLYQQMLVPPLVDLALADPPSSEACMYPSLLKDPASPSMIELYSNSKDFAPEEKMMEPKLEVEPKIRINLIDYSNDEDNEDKEVNGSKMKE